MTTSNNTDSSLIPAICRSLFQDILRRKSNSISVILSQTSPFIEGEHLRSHLIPMKFHLQATNFLGITYTRPSLYLSGLNTSVRKSTFPILPIYDHITNQTIMKVLLSKKFHLPNYLHVELQGDTKITPVPCRDLQDF